MSPTGFVPDRGDLLWIEMNPKAGHEQAGRRPALVLSPASYNGKVGLAICCPITNQTKGYPFEVALPARMQASGVVLADQVKRLDWRARHASRFDHAPTQIVGDVLAKLATLIGAPPL